MSSARSPYGMARQLLIEDLPELLTLASRALRGLPVPRTPGGWAALAMDDWLRLAPALGALALAGAWAARALPPRAADARAPRAAPAAATESFGLARVALVRGMARSTCARSLSLIHI